MKKTGRIVQCRKCGKEFYRRGKFIKKNRYHFCSRDCYATYHREHPEEFSMAPRGEYVKCGWCKKPTYKPQSQIKRCKNLFCSHGCHSEFLKGKSNNRSGTKYKEKSDYFLKKEAKDSGCEICGYNRVIDVCHILPKHRGGKYKDNILYLCANHHRLFDKGRSSKNLRGCLYDEEFEKIRDKVVSA